MSPLPEASEAGLHRELDRAVGDTVRPIARGLCVLFAVYAWGHVLLVQPSVAQMLVAMALGSAALFLGISLMPRDWTTAPGRAHGIALLMCGVVVANSAVHLILVAEPRQTTNLVLAMIGAGVCFLSWPHLALLVTAIWTIWIAIALTSPESPEWAHFGFALAAGTVITLGVHAGRLRAQRRIATLRGQDAARRVELESLATALAESERSQRELVEQGLGFVGTHGLDGLVWSLNEAAAEALGYRRDEIEGRVNLRDILAPSVAASTDGYIALIRRQGRHDGLMRVCTRRGEERVWAYRNVLREESTRGPFVLVHAHDITDRIRLEGELRTARAELERRVAIRTAELASLNEALRAEVAERSRVAEEMARFAQAVDTCRDGILIVDLHGAIQHVNAALLALYGAPEPSALLGKSALDLIAPEERGQIEALSEELFAAGSVASQRYRLATASGGAIPIEATIAVITERSGSPPGLVVVVRDVTERLRIEEAQRRSEAYFRALVENSPLVMVVIDRRGMLRSRPSGPAEARGPFGWREHGLRGQLAGELIHPDDRAGLGEAFASLLAEPAATRMIQARLRRADGTYGPAEIGLRNLLDEPAVEGVLCTIRDLSAQKQVEDALRSAKEAAEAADRAKDEFLATMSHELRTPLHAVLGYTDMLRDEEFGPVLPAQTEALDAIRRRALDQFELISAVLDLSAMATNRLGVNLGPVSLPRLLEDVRAETEESSSRPEVEMTWRCDPDLAPVESDGGKLKVIAKNLVGNAMKFTERGRITVEAERDSEGFELRVTDTGIGIAREDLAVIFDPFRQLDGSSSRRYDGSGLGLHIVECFAKLLGGSVAVSSELGRGSTFVVKLPSRPAAPAAERREEAPATTDAVAV